MGCERGRRGRQRQALPNGMGELDMAAVCTSVHMCDAQIDTTRGLMSDDGTVVAITTELLVASDTKGTSLPNLPGQVCHMIMGEVRVLPAWG